MGLPLPYLIQGVGRQRPREFSISSEPGSQTVDLTVAITEYETLFKRQIVGVCSRWFKALQPGETVPLWLKKGTMTFPADRPLIFVGPGTGVASFRSAIQYLRNSGETMVLIFGCRDQNSDYYY